MRSTVSLLSLLLLLAVSISLFLAKRLNAQFELQPAAKPTPAVATTLRITRTDHTGKAIQRAHASRAEKPVGSEHFLFESPRLFFQDAHQKPWRITANSGSAESLDSVFLKDEVHLSPMDNTIPNPLELWTSALNLHLSDHLATTTAPVTLKRPGMTLHATGAKADLQKNTVTLQSHIQADFK